MAIDAVATDSASLKASGLGMQDFLKILMTQLNHQDPLKPVDNQQFMAQMAQFTALEQTQQLNEKIATLTTNQAALMSIGLIGRSVEIRQDSGNVTGVVSALALSSSAPELSVKLASGSVLDKISLSQLLQVN